MKIFNILSIFVILPTFAFAAGRGDAVNRVGAASRSMRSRMTTVSDDAAQLGNTTAANSTETQNSESKSSADCHDAYFDCMDKFCLLGEDQG